MGHLVYVFMCVVILIQLLRLLRSKMCTQVKMYVICIYTCFFLSDFQSHTILLVQPTKRPEGRTYADYESVNECMEGRIVLLIIKGKINVMNNSDAEFIFFLIKGVCKMYEEHLKRMNPNSPSITYDISQLFDFVDDLADLSCLV